MRITTQLLFNIGVYFFVLFLHVNIELNLINLLFFMLSMVYNRDINLVYLGSGNIYIHLHLLKYCVYLV